MTSSNSTTELNATDHTITLKSGSTFTAPLSWKTTVFENYLKMDAPENDFAIYFLEIPATQSMANIIANAWEQISPGFALKPLQESNIPATDDWENTYQIIYDVPVSESRMVVAFARTFKNHVYLSLVDSKTAGFARRTSEFSIMLESWKPIGFKETSLNNNATKNWSPADTAEFEKFFVDSMQKMQVPGATVAIVRQDGTILYSKAFGVKKVGSNQAVTLDTPFMIGSTTKPLTTLLMAMLIDQKKLSWETPVKTLLKDFKLADESLTRQLQIRHTVSASTGLARRDLYWIFKYQDIHPEDRIKQLQDLKPTTAFGETFQYSNALVMLGGYAAARAYSAQGNLEQAYAQAMQQLVFNPLHMQNTVLKSSDALRLGAAFPHSYDFNGQICELPLAREDAVYSMAPAGAVWSTVKDLSQYLLLELNKGVLQDQRVVSEATLLERRKAGVKASDKIHYGLGLFLFKQQGLDIIGHDGGTLGFSSHLSFFPEKGLGIVILTNASLVHAFIAAVHQKLIELTWSAKPRASQMMDVVLQQQKSAVQKNHESIAFDAKQFAKIDRWLGEYSNDILGNMRFINREGHYAMEFESWTSEIGIESDKDSNKILVLTSPPWPGMFKIQLQHETNQLLLDFYQEQYHFARKQPIHKKQLEQANHE